MTKVDTRHPYTYACDYLRTKVGAHISRADMSQIRGLIADACGLDDRGVAEALAREYHKLSGADFDRCAEAAIEKADARDQRFIGLDAEHDLLDAALNPTSASGAKEE